MWGEEGERVTLLAAAEGCRDAVTHTVNYGAPQPVHKKTTMRSRAEHACLASPGKSRRGLF